MKKLLIGFVALVFLMGCAADRGAQLERVAQFGWTQLRAEGSSYTTTDTLEFDLRHFRGAVTYWVDGDTSSATLESNLSDSCMTISLELYNEDSGEWGKYYSGTTKLDTVDRALVNVAASDADVYIPLAKFNADQFAWADKGRIIELIGTGDKHGGGRWIGGQ